MSNIVTTSEQITFRGQRDGEQVLLLIRRHPWALFRQGLVVTLGLILLLLLFYWFQASQITVTVTMILGPILLIYAALSWYIWWNNMYILTNERVIVVTHRNLWSRKIEDYTLDKIQSLGSITQGIASAMLNFGTVTMAIIGVKEPVQLPYVEDVYAVHDQLNQAIKQLGHRPTIHKYDEPDEDIDPSGPSRPSGPTQKSPQNPTQKSTKKRILPL